MQIMFYFQGGFGQGGGNWGGQSAGGYNNQGGYPGNQNWGGFNR